MRTWCCVGWLTPYGSAACAGPARRSPVRQATAGAAARLAWPIPLRASTLEPPGATFRSPWLRGGNPFRDNPSCLAPLDAEPRSEGSRRGQLRGWPGRWCRAVTYVAVPYPFTQPLQEPPEANVRNWTLWRVVMDVRPKGPRRTRTDRYRMCVP